LKIKVIKMSDCCETKKGKNLKELNKKIKYFYVDGCHAWLDGIKELHETLVEEGFKPNFEVICITTNEEATQYKFCGSPAIQIDELDIDDMAKYVKNYSMDSCRPYHFEGKSFEFPPMGMIKKKLK